MLATGPDENKREGELRLDVRAGAIESAIVPGKPDESELVRRILSDDEDEQMPPADFDVKLSAVQKKNFATGSPKARSTKRIGRLFRRFVVLRQKSKTTFGPRAILIATSWLDSRRKG